MASEITLDLAFRIVSPDHRIFVAFPGRAYKLYDAFIRKEMIFPELPGLDFRPKIAPTDQLNFIRKIKRSEALNKFYNSKNRDQLPSRKLSDYDDTPSKRLSHIQGILNGYFGRARKGDLIVVPSGQLVGPVAIGELLDDPLDFVNTEIPELFEGDTVPARRIRWLAAQAKNKFSSDLIKSFPRPNAFRSVQREFYSEIYPVAYRSYSIEDSFTARFDTTEVDFTSIDNYYLTQVINSVAAISEVYDFAGREASELGNWIENENNDLDELVNLLTDATYVPDLVVNIASPGFVTATCRKAVPLVAAALIALTALGADAVWEAAEAGTIRIENTLAPTDDFCGPPIGQEVVDQIKMMGFERWKRMCERTNGFRDRTGLNGESKAKK